MSKSYDIEDYEHTFLIDTATSDAAALWIDIPDVSATVCVDVTTEGVIRVVVYPGEVTDAPLADWSIDMLAARGEGEAA